MSHVIELDFTERLREPVKKAPCDSEVPLSSAMQIASCLAKSVGAKMNNFQHSEVWTYFLIIKEPLTFDVCKK